ncbi:OmpA family protein [uncultured Sphingomonas sp.]|uniref:OmpA family protein n=1 Tax=uncultured Sphingomonas sp. TaxID=158754 RepID=UPI0025FD8BD0|nr:OmpA family protein [uncultured Sphingomonas sp.]
MNKTAFLLLGAVSLAACDNRAPAPAPSPTPSPAEAATGNEQRAAQSIMQPKVIAESQAVAEPEPTPPVPTEATILFERGAAIDDAAREALDALLANPSLPGEARWVLRGSSDNDGSRAANLRVSRLRAEAVRDYLTDKGIAEERITVIALGDGRPAAPNVTLDGSDDPEGRRQNRRVDIEIIVPEAATPDGADTAAPEATSPAAKATE